MDLSTIIGLLASGVGGVLVCAIGIVSLVKALLWCWLDMLYRQANLEKEKDLVQEYKRDKDLYLLWKEEVKDCGKE